MSDGDEVSVVQLMKEELQHELTRLDQLNQSLPLPSMVALASDWEVSACVAAIGDVLVENGMLTREEWGVKVLERKLRFVRGAIQTGLKLAEDVHHVRYPKSMLDRPQG